MHKIVTRATRFIGKPLVKAQQARRGATVSLQVRARTEGKVADQYHAYSRPMESGNKTDVRWLALTSDSGKGLTVTGDKPLSVNALAFPYEDLYLRKQGTWKSSDIAPHGDGSLLVDLVQTGVGGDTGWSLDGRPLAKYRVKLEPQSYGFTIKPKE